MSVGGVGTAGGLPNKKGVVVVSVPLFWPNKDPPAVGPPNVNAAAAGLSVVVDAVVGAGAGRPNVNVFVGSATFVSEATAGGVVGPNVNVLPLALGGSTAGEGTKDGDGVGCTGIGVDLLTPKKSGMPLGFGVALSDAAVGAPSFAVGCCVSGNDGAAAGTMLGASVVFGTAKENGRVGMGGSADAEAVSVRDGAGTLGVMSKDHF